MEMAAKRGGGRDLRTIAQAMAQLSCSRTTIYKLWQEGKLELVKFGQRTRVTERSLNSLVDEMLTADPIYPQTKPPTSQHGNDEDNKS